MLLISVVGTGTEGRGGAAEVDGEVLGLDLQRPLGVDVGAVGFRNGFVKITNAAYFSHRPTSLSDFLQSS